MRTGERSVNTSHLRPRCWHEFWTGPVPLLDFQSMSPSIPVEVCVSHSVVSDCLRPHGLYPARLLCPSGNNTRVSSHFLLQGIFLTQGSNPGLLHCRQTLYPLSHQGRGSQFDLKTMGKGGNFYYSWRVNICHYFLHSSFSILKNCLFIPCG